MTTTTRADSSDNLSWKYSDPLSGALYAAAGFSKPTRTASDIGLGSSSLYRQYYSGYDPLISRYEARRNQMTMYRPTHADILDDIDDLTLEMEAENLFGGVSRRTNVVSSTYVPTVATTASLYTSQNSLVDHVDKATGTSFIEDNDETRVANNKRRQQQQQQQQQAAADADIKHKASQIPKQPPPKTNHQNNNHHQHAMTNKNVNQQRNNGAGQHQQNGFPINNGNHAKQQQLAPKQQVTTTPKTYRKIKVI